MRARSVDTTTLLAEVGLPQLPVGDPDARLPLIYLDQLWDLAAERLGDANLGLHLAQTVDPSSFGLLSYIGTASATLGEGMQRVFHYFGLLSEGSRYELTVDDELATVTASQDTPPGAPVRQRVEFTVSVLFCYARHSIAGDWQTVDVFFEHPAPPDVTEHGRLFGQPPRFGAPHSGFSFPSALLDQPLRTSNPTLAALLERLATQLLAEQPRATTVSGALRELVLRVGFTRELTLEDAARELHLSPRTLQRRLHEEGTSLHDVVDDARRYLASRMLTQSSLGIAEVAFALGFSAPGALHRAFKRWTGTTPARYRRARRTA